MVLRCKLEQSYWSLCPTMNHPNAKAGAPSRVVNVSSGAHRRGGVIFEDMMLENAYDPWRIRAVKICQHSACCGTSEPFRF